MAADQVRMMTSCRCYLWNSYCRSGSTSPLKDVGSRCHERIIWSREPGQSLNDLLVQGFLILAPTPLPLLEQEHPDTNQDALGDDEDGGTNGKGDDIATFLTARDLG